MKKQLSILTITALLTTGQSAMAFEQINSENGYDSAVRNGWVDQTPKSAQTIKVSYLEENKYVMKFGGGNENDTGVITFTFPASEELIGSSDPLLINYDSKF